MEPEDEQPLNNEFVVGTIVNLKQNRGKILKKLANNSKIADQHQDGRTISSAFRSRISSTRGFKSEKRDIQQDSSNFGSNFRVRRASRSMIK